MKTTLPKSAFLFFFFTLLNITRLQAQQPPIMVCSPDGNTCAPYITFDEAYTAANAGDYIYLPGGSFQLSLFVTKEIHVYGAGFNLSQSVVTGPTHIDGDINLGTGADNCSFEGLYLTGGFYSQGATIDHLKLHRCNFNALAGYTFAFNNTLITHCVARDNMYFADSETELYGENNTILNSIVEIVIKMNNSVIKNSILRNTPNAYYDYVIYTCKNVQVQNNIISPSGVSITNSTNVFFSNNYYDGYYDITSSCNQCTSINNISNATTPFVNADYYYDESFDFHLNADSPANNAGTDGTDIGIYGGTLPWKDGSVPSNPHIFFKEISPTTNTGNLPVHIKVSAED